ncbi:MAG: DUF1275 domain-containing protein [Candidatus Firestonebacteria bacterium]|nr:DUF1275 domain-containing protein [Candidatus Firestonebacteria bacterium]
MFNRENRNHKDNTKLGGIFVFIGGYIGLLTGLLLGHSVNCMSGNITDTGITLATLDFHEAFLLFLVIFAFIFGAFLSAKILDNFKYGYLLILIIESILLFHVKFLLITQALLLASLAMGLQNGFTTYTTWEEGKIRTTHITGTTTDIGVSLANKDFHETKFNLFQASMFFLGAIFAFFVAQKIGNTAFFLAGGMIILVLLIDSGKKFLLKTSSALV